MDDTMRDYIDVIALKHRALFDRLHRLVLKAHPDATVVLAVPRSDPASATIRATAACNCW